MRRLPEPSSFLAEHGLFRAGGTAFVFDFDGTLAELRTDPQAVRLPDRDIVNLKTLHRLCGGKVFILSGRPLPFLEALFGEGLLLTGEHGAESNFFELREKAWAYRPPQGPPAAFLEELTLRYPCSSLERKKTSLVWHYRRCGDAIGEREIQELLDETNRRIADDVLRCHLFNRVLELKPRLFSKAVYIGRLLDTFLAGHRLVCFGDDEPEAELFRLIRGRGVSVAIGERLPNADYGLDSPAQLRQWLEELVATLLKTPPPFSL